MFHRFRIFALLMLVCVIGLGGYILFARWRWNHGLTVQLTPLLSWQTRNYGGQLLALTPDGGFVATNPDGQHAQIILKSLTDSRVETTFTLPNHYGGYQPSNNDIAIDATGTWLAAGCRTTFTVCVWAIADAELLGTVSTARHTDGPLRFTFSATDSQLQLAQDDTVETWAIPRLQRTRQLVLQNATAFGGWMTMSPQGTYVAKNTPDGMVSLWDGETGAFLQTLTGHSTNITDLVFSPDDQLLATAGFDQRIRIWQLPEGRLLHTITTIGESALAFSPDGRLLASGDGQEAGNHGLRGNSYVFLWDPRTGARVGRTEILHADRDGYIRDVRFSADGQLLGGADSDGIVHVWTVSPRP
jgi:WD40 repeat protein